MGTLKLLEELENNRLKKITDKEDIVSWIMEEADDYTHAVTLTFPYDMEIVESAEKYFGRFAHRLNQHCNKRRSKEIKKVKMAVLMHGVKNTKGLHYHCAMRCPDDMEQSFFSSHIQKHWRNVLNNQRTQVKIEQYQTRGWMDYIAKETTTANPMSISEHNNF